MRSTSSACDGTLIRVRRLARAVGVVRVRYHGLEHKEEQLTPEDGPTFEHVLRARAIHPETVLVFLDGAPVPVETEVPPEGEVRVLRILSGG